VVEQAGDERTAHLREPELVVGVVERVDVAFEQRQVRVHPGAERALDGLGAGVYAESWATCSARRYS
jgi:hypothetical protein